MRALEKRQRSPETWCICQKCVEKELQLCVLLSQLRTDHMFNAHPDSGAAHWLQYIVCTRGSVI